MSDRPEIEIQRQTAFGDDGQLKLTETSVEISLEALGLTWITAIEIRGSIAPKRVSSTSTTGLNLSKRPRGSVDALR